MPGKLKVYRTTVGFRDAYVAAPSKAAALRAWGTDKDLFARGAAELVTDPALAEAALGNPGELVYQSRGGLKEQVAALGALPKRKLDKGKAGKDKKVSKPAAERKLVPRPSRKALDAAEHAVASLRADQERDEKTLRAKERALAKERAAMEQRHSEALAKLDQAEAQAREAYQAALQRWEP